MTFTPSVRRKNVILQIFMRHAIRVPARFWFKYSLTFQSIQGSHYQFYQGYEFKSQLGTGMWVCFEKVTSKLIKLTKCGGYSLKLFTISHVKHIP